MNNLEFERVIPHAARPVMMDQNRRSRSPEYALCPCDCISSRNSRALPWGNESAFQRFKPGATCDYD